MMLSITPTLFSVFIILCRLAFLFVLVRRFSDFGRFSKQEAACLEDKAQGAINRVLDLICEVCICEPPLRGSSPGVDDYRCIYFSLSMKHFYCSILKVSIFLVYYQLFLARITRLHIYTEPTLKSDRFGPIIWYQSLGGSFQLWFGRIYIGKPPET
ncbi:hypothetical protein HanRHA438_Chr05g0232411 [Helianthus annuus]|nr:hypothetical protein HanRHA438_Chr05g0232411 [Helianthus annuus]